ncbi:BppU family phage baseplate upper protein [Bacillus xiapuensis]|uniref:BppU family phage baseplate upper protein n=1 Tax=Bacillus xiapuensis TaxID=2014075 RepID=A0ABU6N7M4_9BACI|nr:BppU family phage baseplate upper protein [Bacillus xiapuensis]
MTTEIVQGDNGTILELIIQDDNQVIDLTGATVQVVITYKSTGKIKQAVVTDAINGKCEVTLNSDDVLFDGVYSFQATVIFPNGNKFTSNIQRFTVTKKMGFIPNTAGNGNGDPHTEIISGINGHILVNGIDVKVYDDSQVKSDITNLKSSQHTHANKSTLDKLSDDGINLLFNGLTLGNGGSGSSVSDSTTNGNILINGSEVNVYDDTQINSDITKLKANEHNHMNMSVLNLLSTDGINLLFNGAKITFDDSEILNKINLIQNSDVVKRLGVSTNGKLTIDGAEVTIDDPTSPIDGGTFTTTYNTNIVDGGEF